LTKITCRIEEGVIFKRDKSYVYNAAIELVSKSSVLFKIKDEITITIDWDQLKTKAQQTLHGYTGMLALPQFDKEILRDNTYKIYLHFKNKSLQITKNGISEFRRDNSTCIWAEQVINHEISPDDGIKPVFQEFVHNIAGEENYEAFITTYGYLIHNYNGSDGLRAVWYCDEDHEAGKKKGPSGKSMSAKASSKVRKKDECSGKDFMEDDRFKFQDMNSDTQLYVIEDVKDKFDFKALYTYCSEGAEYQRKGKDRVKLSIHETPKLIITSNNPPSIEEGPSTTGRLIILPVKNYYIKYAEQGGVKKVHGHTFFDDWDSTKWNRFYWFLAKCAKKYLREGLKLCNLDAIYKNRLKDICAKKFKDNSTAEDFIDWVYEQEEKVFKQFRLQELLECFKTEEEISEKTFAGALLAFFDIKGWWHKKERHTVNHQKITIWKTGVKS
jgi:hypothetical protein